MKQYTFTFLTICLLISCVKSPRNRDDCHQILYIINQMDKDIAFDFDSGEKVSYVPNYKSKVTLIKAKGKNKYTIVHGCFEEYFEFSNKCYLFLWDIDMLKNIPKDTIRKYNIYSHRIELTLEQLDSLDWTVTVP